MSNERKDPRNNHLNLQFTASDRAFNNQDTGRAFPTTPSTFPQPLYTGQNGQREVWGTQQGPSTMYPGGPPGYFPQTVNLQQPSLPSQSPIPGNAGYNRPPGAGGYNDGTNGLAHQFAHQNLSAAPQTPRSASPYIRQPSPAAQSRTVAQDGQQQQQQQTQQPYGRHLAPVIPGLSVVTNAQDAELPVKQPEKYGDNIYRRGKMSSEFTNSFFKDSVDRAKQRNERVIAHQQLCQRPDVSERAKQTARTDLRKKEAQYIRMLRRRESSDNYETVKIIGKGAFGEVRLVKHKKTRVQYALKSLIKAEMYKRDQLAHVRAERDILAQSESVWVVKLHTTFQDRAFLYMLMEFLPGGDLMTMLIKYEIFSEDITRFYMAELVLAIADVHKLGFIHRDIKPDNIILDIGGHIKLTDFGLSTGFHNKHDQAYYQQLMHGKAQPSKSRDNRASVNFDQIQLTVSKRNQVNTWRKSRRQLAYSTVGTPDYIAPEIFTGKGYDFSCDWWSVGTIMFECLIGWPPFCAEESTETYRKIVDWPRHLHFPPDQKLSGVAEDVIRGLITDSTSRLGTLGGATEIKQHPFFRGVDWNGLRKIGAPFKPRLTSETDTQYFPVDEIPQQDNSAAVRAAADAAAAEGDDGSSEMDYPFAGYTYKRFDAFKAG